MKQKRIFWVFTIMALVASCTNSQARKKPIIADISAGPVVFFNSDFVNTTEKLWDNNTYWGADISVNTTYGYHMAVYTFSNSLSVWNGIYLNKKKTIDAYGFYIHDLTSKERYAGIGGEYAFGAGKLDIYPYIQLGFKTDELYTLRFSTGVMLCISGKLWNAPESKKVN